MHPPGVSNTPSVKASGSYVYSNHHVCPLSLQPKRRSLRLKDVSTDMPGAATHNMHAVNCILSADINALCPHRDLHLQRQRPNLSQRWDLDWITSDLTHLLDSQLLNG